MAPSSAELEQARTLLARAERVVVLTGAGVSAESGVPTFRGEDGLWKQHRPEELATPEAFARDPRLVWEWYGWRREKVAACAPNAGHLALARFALDHGGVLLVTQNVDGLHQQAARALAAERGEDHAPAWPAALHGNLFGMRCTRCPACWEHRDTVDASSAERLPHCADCGALARPDIVWFGESLPEATLMRAFRQAELARVCLVVGTAGVVQPAASVAAVTAQAGGEVIEVNLDETVLSSLCSVSLRGPAAEILPAILDGAAG